MPATAAAYLELRKWTKICVGCWFIFFLLPKIEDIYDFFWNEKGFHEKYFCCPKDLLGFFFAYLLPAILCGAKSLSRHPLIPNSSSFCMEEEEEAKSNHSNSLET